MSDKMKVVVVTLCLCLLLGSAVGQQQEQPQEQQNQMGRRQGGSLISNVIRHACQPFHFERLRYGGPYGMCNKKVVDEVHDRLGNMKFFPHLGMFYSGDFVETALKRSRFGHYCYQNGLSVFPVMGQCNLMDLVCNGNVNVDLCRSMRTRPRFPMTTASPFPRAPGNPRVPSNPGAGVPPAGPRFPANPPNPGAPPVNPPAPGAPRNPSPPQGPRGPGTGF